jgi:potassium voltage-gated channel Shaw-related subfamily C member 1
VLFVSIFTFVVETTPYFRLPYSIASNLTLSRKMRADLTTSHPLLLLAEHICNIFFLIEFLIKFIVSPSKRNFLTDVNNWIEFLAISPIFFPDGSVYKSVPAWSIKIHKYIQVFYVLRIFRLFSLVPNYSGLRILLVTLRNSVSEFVMYLLLLLMTTLIFASFAFYAEQINEVEGNKFESIPVGLYWAIITMTTVGYIFIQHI